MCRFIVIGITDNPNPWFPPEVLEIIQKGRIFSGGKRHHEIVVPLLPEGAEWIDITVPLAKVFEQYKRPTPNLARPQQRSSASVAQGRLTFSQSADSLATRKGGEAGAEIIIFASGDPLFFGFANTLRREFPDAEMQVFPTFNSLQMLAHRLVMPYHDMRIVSLTGRPWQEFDRALIEHAPKMGVLTDKEHTPAAIAQRMLEYGYTHYTMHVGEHLGNPGKEKVRTLTLEEAAEKEFAMPNCIILDPPPARPNGTLDPSRTPPVREGSSSTFGIPDQAFTLLDGREKMITKMPIRLLTLQALDLPNRKVFWDIGACTGSVSIEARLLFPHLHIEAFEIRPECEAIIKENARKFGALGLEIHIGDFSLTPDPSPKGEGRPDAIFIGGHGGRLKEIMAKVEKILAPGGVIVMNSVKAPLVKTDSHQLWDEACAELGLQQEPPTRILLDDHHPIEILKAVKGVKG